MEDENIKAATAMGMHRVVEAEKQLRQFLVGASASPLVRPSPE
jgi:hypothetical protein